MSPTLWAVSDLHVTFAENRRRVEQLTPRDAGDWLIIAGDVAESLDLVASTLSALKSRFARVIYTPGNHELFAKAHDRFTGVSRYERIIDLAREIGVDTPEDPYPRFGEVSIAPLFTLYDYSFQLGSTSGKEVSAALQAAQDARASLDDLLLIAPFVDIPAWCAARIDYTRQRLASVDGPLILANHWPLAIEPAQRLPRPEMALWCGTQATRSFLQDYQVLGAVHGHLHMPSEIQVEGVPLIDVSLGYPFEHRPHPPRAWPMPLLRLK